MRTASRERAEVLRRKGKSLKEVAAAVHISQSTASRWCADIPLTAAQQKALDEKRLHAGLKALKPWIKRNRDQKALDIRTQEKKGRADVGRISKRDLFMLGLGLYWGEGYKRGSQEFGFTNSDPAVIRIVMAWLRQSYSIGPDRLRARLTLNARYQSELKRLTREWADETSIPLGNFSAPSIITGYGKPDRNPRTYRGTLRVKVIRGTSLRRRILASIAAASA